MNLSYWPIGVYLGAALLLGGILYKYVIKRDKFDIGQLLLLIVYSLIAGNGFLLMFKGLDFVFFDSRLLGNIDPGEMKGIISIGSLTGIAAIAYLFTKYLRSRE